MKNLKIISSVKYKGLKYAVFVTRISNGISPDSKKPLIEILALLGY
jgi:hypothetical protein